MIWRSVVSPELENRCAVFVDDAAVTEANQAEDWDENSFFPQQWRANEPVLCAKKIVRAQPDYDPALCVLGLIDAALGRKDLAWTKAGERSRSCRWKKMSTTAAASFIISPLQ
jgi:hypothetical protein